MRPTALVLITLFLFQNVLIAQIEQDVDHYCSKAHSASRFFNPSFQNRSADDTYDLKYSRFEWTINPAVNFIKGTVTHYFTINSEGFDEIKFDFSKKLVIDSITYHGQKLSYEQPSTYGLIVTLPSVLPIGSIDSISITYQGAPASGGLGSFTQSTHNGSPVIWTLSAPFGSQDWWPCKNDLSDKIDSMDVYITTNNAYKAASNGIFMGEKEVSPTQKVHHWKHRYPISPYLVALAVTNYSVFTHDVKLSDGSIMPMVNYVYPENLTNATSGTLANVKSLQYFDSLFVDYPFKKEKYGHAQFGWGGGMEHQTMSFVSTFDWGLLAHELAHQWFGDMVTCGSWEDVWLNEGFATYLEGLSRERYPQTANDWYNWKRGKINSIISNASGSVKVDKITDVNRIFSGRLTYNKGGYLLHMIRWKLGDQNFYTAIRNYLNNKNFKYAVTPDFVQHLETVSGEDLTEFFKDWYAGQGYPSYNVKWAQADTKVKLLISQTSSHPSVSFFDMPVEIKLSNGSESKTIRLDHAFSGQTFDVEIPFQVATVEFDPNLWIAARHTLSKDNTILSNLENYTFSYVQVSPNPFDDTFIISNLGNGTIAYEVMDVSGRVLFKNQIANSTENIDLEKYSDGVYFVKLRDAHGKIDVRKMVKK